MKRHAGYGILLIAGLLVLTAAIARDAWQGELAASPTKTWMLKGILLLATIAATYGFYLLVSVMFGRMTKDKRRRHDVRNVLRLVFGAAGIIAVAGVVTEQWLGVLFSLGVVGFAITFALQQPLFSLLGWFYIMLKRPYQVGDRVKIEDAKGDVIDVDFLVTTLWEINGDLVSTHQPSGRVVTVPNSVVLSTQIFNYSREDFPFVWAELPIQVSYDTDLEFAQDIARQEADDYLGDEMERSIAQYREQLAQTPVELEVRDRPSVNIKQEESWVELRVRFLSSPKRIQQNRNALYQRVLQRFNDHPDRISYPVGRFR